MDVGHNYWVVGLSGDDLPSEPGLITERGLVKVMLIPIHCWGCGTAKK